MEDTQIATQEMIEWFADGEVDINLMLRLNLITHQQIIELWKREHE